MQAVEQKNFTIQDFFGYHPNEFQAQFHHMRRQQAYTTLIAHRRMGKTEANLGEHLEGALTCQRRLPIFQYIAPTLKQAKLIVWDKLKFYVNRARANGLTCVDISETDAKVIFKHRSDPATISLAGWEEPESLRGPYVDGLTCDEVADMPDGIWGTVLAPKLADRKGWATFTGTVKGINQLFDFYRKGIPGPDKDPHFGSLYFPISVTRGKIPWLDEEALETLRAGMTETQWRQEMECDWNASVENVLIVLDRIMGAVDRHRREHEYAFAAHVLGIDVARFGDDSSTFRRRQGLVAFPGRHFSKVDSAFLAAAACREAEEYQLDGIVVDGTGGYGAGVVDALHQMHAPCPVFEIISNAQAFDPVHYYNRRAEMWDAANKWLETGSIPQEEKLIRDLASPTYEFVGTKMKLESKDEIRKRLGRSPDDGDALALTFAVPISPRRHDDGWGGGSVKHQAVDNYQIG